MEVKLVVVEGKGEGREIPLPASQPHSTPTTATAHHPTAMVMRAKATARTASRIAEPINVTGWERVVGGPSSNPLACPRVFGE